MSKQQVEVSHAVSTASQLIEALFHKVKILDITGKVPVPLMIWGQPGVGKSQIVRAVGKLTGRPVRDLRLLLKDPTDIAGLPFYNDKSGLMEYGLPVDFPTNADANDIILLDELPSAPASVQAAALQLVLERQIGSYQLPENVIIVAAGNRTTDGTVHFSMPTPLRNRFEHVQLEVNAESWLEWAMKAGVHPAVQSYIKANPQDLNAFDPSQKTRYAFATPRAWGDFVSDQIKGVEALRKNKIDVTENQLFRSITGIIGSDMSIKFKAHYAASVKLPDPFEVVKGNIKAAKIESMSLRYNCCLNLAYALRELLHGQGSDTLTEKQKTEYIDNTLSFLIKKGNIDEKDLIISTFQLMIGEGYKLDISNSKVVDELLDDPEFEKFFQAI